MVWITIRDAREFGRDLHDRVGLCAIQALAVLDESIEHIDLCRELLVRIAVNRVPVVRDDFRDILAEFFSAHLRQVF
jgi:hypothetical protein